MSTVRAKVRACVTVMNTKTVPSTIDDIAPSQFVDEAVDQSQVKVGVGVDYAGGEAFARARNSSKVWVALGLTAKTIPS